MRAKAHDYYEELGGGVNSDILDEAMDARQVRALTEEASVQDYMAISSLTALAELQGQAAANLQGCVSLVEYFFRGVVIGVEHCLPFWWNCLLSTLVIVDKSGPPSSRSRRLRMDLPTS